MTYYQQFKEQQSNRDPYFKYTLNLFNQKPINILELGCSRDFNSRLGDGWSSFHFLEYIDKYGGNFTTVDLYEENIKNCFTLLSSYPNFESFQNKLQFVVGDALNVLDDKRFYNETINLVYLDVGDSPVLTINCFRKINLDNTVVFVDDFSSKGILLAEKHPDFLEMGWPAPIGHKMALYNKNQIPAKMVINTIEK